MEVKKARRADLEKGKSPLAVHGSHCDAVVYVCFVRMD